MARIKLARFAAKVHQKGTRNTNKDARTLQYSLIKEDSPFVQFTIHWKKHILLLLQGAWLQSLRIRLSIFFPSYAGWKVVPQSQSLSRSCLVITGWHFLWVTWGATSPLTHLQLLRNPSTGRAGVETTRVIRVWRNIARLEKGHFYLDEPWQPTIFCFWTPR